jgi:DNA-binding NtrC family response regulator
VSQFRTSEQIVGCSSVMCRVMERVNTIAASDAPLLVVGETGTGKRLIARAVHERSRRGGERFMAIDGASFSDSALEAARGGTLLLDEVGDMSPAGQARLLRLLHEPSIDVRVIAATQRDLAKLTEAGLFDDGLYRHLSVLNIDVPPLRARRGDLPLLTQYFLNRFHRPGSRPARMSSAAWSALSTFGFPGNVRQLARAIEHASVLAAGGALELRHFPAAIGASLADIEISVTVQRLEVAAAIPASGATPQARFQRLMRA